MTRRLPLLFTLLALVMPASSAIAQAPPAHGDVLADLPAVVFPGHAGIGANYGRNQADDVPDTAWTVGRGEANRFDRLYLPGEPVELTVPIVNDGEQPVRLSGTWRWVWVGDREADHLGGVRYEPIALHDQQPLEPTTVEPGQRHEVAFRFDAPQRRGCLALYLEAEENQQTTRRWVTNIAVIFPVAQGAMPESMFMGDPRGVRLWHRLLELPVLKRMGVQWVRVGESWGRLEPRRGELNWDSLDREVQQARELNMFAIYLGGIGADWTRAYGRLPWPRNNPQKFSGSPDPSRYGDWADLFEQIATRYGDVIRAVNVFNEPWELGGISNWGGTGQHYRTLQRMAHLGVSRSEHPDVLVGGNDSQMNISDNLLVDPAWASYTDLFTVHGGKFTDQVMHRVQPDMPMWNTEHWYTAFSDRTVQDQVFMSFAGVDRSNLVVLGNFFTAGYRSGGYYGPRDRDNVPDLVPHPNAVAYNTMAHLLEGMTFSDELAPGHLPFLALFERQAHSTDAADHGATLVVIGQHERRGEQVWSQALAEAGEATLRLPVAAAERLAVLNRFGNPVPPTGDAYRLPMGTEPVYLTADDAEALRAAAAALEVLEHPHPVQVGVTDALAAGQTTLTVTLANAMPQPLEARVRVEAGAGVQLEGDAQQTVQLPPGEPVSVELPMRLEPTAGGAAVTVSVDTPVGRVQRTERVQLRQVHRVSPTVDAAWDDWLEAGVTPLIVNPAGDRQEDAIATAMPWEALVEQDQGQVGRWALGYDEQHLYLIAELRNPERGERVWDQTRSDWFELNPGGYSYAAAPRLPFSGENLQLALDTHPNPEDGLYPEGDPRARRFPAFTTDYLLGFYETAQGDPQAWMYRQPGDPYRHRYPFSPHGAYNQFVAPGVQLAVVRDDQAGTTTWEAAIPLTLLPDLDADPGATLAGADVKIGTRRWSGLFSGAGRGSSRLDQSVFQPYWMPGYRLMLPWRFEPR
jgi:hypothetical protein